MFIRPCYRKQNGKRHAYWALVESYRTDRGPRQRVVAYLGQLKETERQGVKQAAEGKRKNPYQQLQLFDEGAKCEPEWVEVDTANVRVENQLDELTIGKHRRHNRRSSLPFGPGFNSILAGTVFIRIVSHRPRTFARAPRLPAPMEHTRSREFTNLEI